MWFSFYSRIRVLKEHDLETQSVAPKWKEQHSLRNQHAIRENESTDQA